MSTNCKRFLATALCAAACSQLGLAQVTPPTILVVQTENVVSYVGDVSEVSKFATEAGVTTVSVAGPRNLGTALIIADIVAVNGKPAKGTVVINQRTINLRAAPTP